MQTKKHKNYIKKLRTQERDTKNMCDTMNNPNILIIGLDKEEEPQVNGTDQNLSNAVEKTT